MDPLEALKGVVKALDLSMDLKHAKAESKPDSTYREHNGRKVPRSYKFTGIKGVFKDPTAEFCVYPGSNGKLVYAWEICTRQSTGAYISYIDAATNTQILDVHDLRRSMASFKV